MGFLKKGQSPLTGPETETTLGHTQYFLFIKKVPVLDNALCWIRNYPVLVIFVKALLWKKFGPEKLHFLDDLDKCIFFEIFV